MEAVFSFLAEGFDLPILDWIASHLACPFLDRAMPILTALANGGIFWIILSVLLLLAPKCRKAGLSMALALLMGLLICNITMKPLFARTRPFDYQLQYFGRVIPLLIEAPQDYSFPSGHTICSFEAATALFLRDKESGVWALILAGFIAFSRLYLYVHYPTDVLCSMILGVAIGTLATKIVDGGHRALRRRGIL